MVALAQTNNDDFRFSDENAAKVERILAKYPANQRQSGVLPLLDIAQRQNGNWLSRAAIQHVADVIGMPLMRVYEVASFYTMFNLKPVGKHLVQVCRTTPCWLRGSDAIEKACKKHLGIGVGETTPDGKFTLVEVECLGACVNAPVVQINDHYYEDLTEENLIEVLDSLAKGRKTKVGSQVGRQGSSPIALKKAIKKGKS